MNTKVWMMGLLTVATVVISLPARSHADTATIQENTQDTLTTGDRNYTRQDSRQTSVDNSRRRTGNRGTVQRSTQTTDTAGKGNDTIQNNNQTSVENGRETRRTRRR